MSIIAASDLTKTFHTHGASLRALDHCTFSLEEGASLGIVGESGSGKSTLANILCGFLAPDAGSLEVAGISWPLRRADRRKLYANVQMIFQNPHESFDPKMTLGASIREPVANFHLNAAEALSRMESVLDRVGLTSEHVQRYPLHVSGGECQRAAIARALMVAPRLLICDEATSALDVSAQAHVLDLIRETHRDLGCALLFISHDLAVVSALCDQIIVLYQGRIVEAGPTHAITSDPQHPYTRMLLSSVPEIRHTRCCDQALHAENNQGLPAEGAKGARA